MTDIRHMNKVAARLGLRPAADPELIFWRQKCLDRAMEINHLNQQLLKLRDELEELHKEMNS